MALNTYQVTEAMSGRSLPLRGDMAATLNFVPADGFLFKFSIDQPGAYVISSSTAQIRGFDGVKRETFTMTGGIGMFAKFVYDKTAQCWKVIETNLVGAGAVVSGGGSGGSGTGTGTGATAEVLLTQNSAGEITPDKALGNRFRVIMTKPLIVKNPVGYVPGEDIAIAVRQGPLGPFTWDWGSAYAFRDRQPPTPANQPGALMDVYARLTDDIDANNKGGWLIRIAPEGSNVGYGVSSFIARNATTGTGYYVLRSGTVPAEQCAMTSMLPGQSLKIIRSGLGVEAYGAIAATNGAGNYLITGVQDNGNRAELRTGTGVRTAFDRGVLAFSGAAGATVTVQDLILSGAREQGSLPTLGSACGINMSDGTVQLTVKNVKFYDNENGLLTGNIGNANPADDFTGSVTLIDCELDRNGVGLDGFTHNIYMGHSNGNFKALRTSFTNCVGAHDIKSRMGYTELKQVLAKGATRGRELNLPVGGKLLAENCTFWKTNGSIQGNLVGIGEETVDASRPREYIFRNCRFQNDYGSVNDGKDATFVANFDTVPMQFIDCEFVGDATKAIQGTHVDYPGLITVNGIRYNPSYPPVFTLTGGPIGPVLPAGYVPIAVTPVAG